MFLKKINSIYFNQRNQVVKSICQNHRIKQGVKKQKTQVTMEICNTRPHFPSKYTKIKLNDLKINALLTFIAHQSLEIKFHPLKGAKDVAKLSLTCKDLRYHSDMSNTETVSKIAKERKNAFENEVNQFVNLFKDDNGNFKHRNDIANEINNGTIMLPEDLLSLKEGFKTVFSNMDDFPIFILLVDIKDNISQDKLAELASVAIEKMSYETPIYGLLRDIKNNISQEKLEELACISIEKMTVDIQIRRLLLGIKDNISPNKLEELASVAIEKMSDDIEIGNLLEEIKDNISQDKLEEFASTAISKMSIDISFRFLLNDIKDNLSQNKLEELASVAINKMSDDLEIKILLNDIKDKIDEDLYNKLKYNIYEKNILEQWKTNK